MYCKERGLWKSGAKNDASGLQPGDAGTSNVGGVFGFGSVGDKREDKLRVNSLHGVNLAGVQSEGDPHVLTAIGVEGLVDQKQRRPAVKEPASDFQHRFSVARESRR